MTSFSRPSWIFRHLGIPDQLKSVIFGIPDPKNIGKDILQAIQDQQYVYNMFSGAILAAILDLPPY